MYAPYNPILRSLFMADDSPGPPGKKAISSVLELVALALGLGLRRSPELTHLRSPEMTQAF